MTDQRINTAKILQDQTFAAVKINDDVRAFNFRQCRKVYVVGHPGEKIRRQFQTVQTCTKIGDLVAPVAFTKHKCIIVFPAGQNISPAKNPVSASVAIYPIITAAAVNVIGLISAA